MKIKFRKSFDKKGKIPMAAINAAILAIILIVVLFEIYAELVPEAQDAANTLNDSNRCAAEGCWWNFTTDVCYNSSGRGFDSLNTTDTADCPATTFSYPLGNIFDGAGFIFVIIMALLVVLVIKSLLKGK